MVLKKLSKIVSLMQLFANVSKKSKAIIAIYYMHQKVLVFSFRKWCWLLCYDLRVSKILVFEVDEFCQISVE